ncbi:acetyltransferase [Hymenobacter pini]|uniref:acetyltransferase n=1 Tax=Hymenobacter pini TaxID=2880879 RepID=UPI001CF58863|nr:acetyltransferase [Hymenobacter pini]MCA8830480.1 acetyltransferase [Hymenobacter pini]
MNIVIYGTGTQAELAYYFLAQDTEHEVVAFCVDAAYIDPHKPTLFHLPIISVEDLPSLFPPLAYQVHIALGHNLRRAQAFSLIKTFGYTCFTYIGSRALTWPNVVIGENVFIDPSTELHPFVQIGDNSIIGGTQIGHHARVGSNIMATSCLVGAKCTIGDGTYLGLNCVIREGVTIGKNNLIGACAYIDHDTEDDAVYSGPKSTKRAVPSSRVSFFNV